MRVVIMGCGRVGARVASLLDHPGNAISVIDTDSRSFRRLPAGFGGETVIGTGIDDPVREDTYRRLGLTTVCPTTTISAIILDHVMRSASDDGVVRGGAT
jgi:Trk K+ transport system NAD-binding subunit